MMVEQAGNETIRGLQPKGNEVVSGSLKYFCGYHKKGLVPPGKGGGVHHRELLLFTTKTRPAVGCAVW